MASKINNIIFDKQELTKGEPFIIDYLNNDDNLFLLKISASLESQSRHPIASALVKEAKENLSLIPIKAFILNLVEVFPESWSQLMG